MSTMQLVEAAATGTAVAEIVAQFGRSSQQYTSHMLAKMEEQVVACSVFGDVPFYDEDTVLHASPIADTICESLGSDDEHGVLPPKTYVLLAKPSLGKTTAAVSIFKNLLPEEGIKGLMFTGRSMQSNYFENVARELDVPYTSDWVTCLIAALKPAPSSKKIPLLILDEFNESGPENINIQLMDVFMRRIYGQGIMCLVVTEEPTVATKLVKLNMFQKIEPLPTALDEITHGDEAVIDTADFSITKAGNTCYRKWKSFKWELHELLSLAEKRCAKKSLPFDHRVRGKISEDMTPTEVVGILDTLGKVGLTSPGKLGSNDSVYIHVQR